MTKMLIAAILLVSLPTLAWTMDGHAVQPDAIKWSAPPPMLPPGAQQAVLVGDPAKAGSAYVLRFKAPAGYKIPAHTHPGDENVTVLKGSMHIGMGDKLDMNKGEKLGTGAYMHIAKGMRHYVWFSEPGEIQVHGIGPVDFNYVNPADDPRNIAAKRQ
jgi:quercetin dioxygenase-like cupin family protein